jgi:hypothetical protein
LSASASSRARTGRKSAQARCFPESSSPHSKDLGLDRRWMVLEDGLRYALARMPIFQGTHYLPGWSHTKHLQQGSGNRSLPLVIARRPNVAFRTSILQGKVRQQVAKVTDLRWNTTGGYGFLSWRHRAEGLRSVEP